MQWIIEDHFAAERYDDLNNPTLPIPPPLQKNKIKNVILKYIKAPLGEIW